MSGSGKPSRVAAIRNPASGARRLRSTSYESAFSGEMYSTDTPRFASSGAFRLRRCPTVSASSGSGSTGLFASRSRHQRNAASVFPDPVGASSNVCSPDAIASQPRSALRWPPQSVDENQASATGENGANGSIAVITRLSCHNSRCRTTVLLHGRFTVLGGRRSNSYRYKSRGWQLSERRRSVSAGTSARIQMGR